MVFTEAETVKHEVKDVLLGVEVLDYVAFEGGVDVGSTWSSLVDLTFRDLRPHHSLCVLSFLPQHQVSEQ